MSLRRIVQPPENHTVGTRFHFGPSLSPGLSRFLFLFIFIFLSPSFVVQKRRREEEEGEDEEEESPRESRATS
jgi:hypothetical protein